MAEPTKTASDLPSYSRGEADIAPRVPFVLRVTAAWSWRIIIVAVIVGGLFWIFTSLATLFIPLIIALLIAAPLERAVFHMNKWGVPRGLGALLTLLALLGVVGFLLGAASTSIISGFGDLQEAAVEGFETFITWLAEGPLHISQEQLDGVVAQVQDWLTSNAGGLASGALGAASTIGGVVAGAVIALFALFFFLRDGRKLWLWGVGLLPDEAEQRVDVAGSHAWSTLRRYTQTTVFVAFVDAVGIGMAAWILGVPLALPIAILVFLFSFIPMFGATLSGAIASLVALVDGGWTTALLMLGAVLLVQQLEGNVLYPWLFGKALSLHPLVVLLTITAGTITLGLVGAIIAVPIVSFVYAFGRGLSKTYAPDEEEVPPITSQVPVFAERSRDAVRRARSKMSRTGEIRVRQSDAMTDGQHRGADESLTAGPTSAESAPGATDATATEERRPTTGTIRIRGGAADNEDGAGDGSDAAVRGTDGSDDPQDEPGRGDQPPR
ncbi:AI-2E family transporter [Demequina globuliformis]|uniref:AI-2E family transporter n=1 Tax=Demequina globuliformis TaxID=676202 RepID=UPI000780FEE9|nr:AI-2E family transporter [Demequina globuliformis]